VQAKSFASKQEVSSIPTTMIFLKGVKLESIRGLDEKAVTEAIAKHKPIVGEVMSWSAPGPAEGFSRYDDLAEAERAKVDAIATMAGCTRKVAAAVLQKHKGDSDAASMDILTDATGCAAYAEDKLGVADPAAALGHAAGELEEGAAVPDKAGGAALQFRLDGKASVRIKETFDKTATVGAVGKWLKTKLPSGATFDLCTRRGPTEMALSDEATLEAVGLAPRGLVLVTNCAAPKFI